MSVTPISVPDIPIERVQGRMARLWDPFERNPHIGVFAQSGAGKSHLIRYRILPLRWCSRTVVIDVKEDRDSVWAGFGKPVTELEPQFFRSGSPDAPYTWRLVVDRRHAQDQLRRVFDQIRSEGHCVLVIDESRAITDREQVGLGSVVEDLILVGRGLGISVIMGAQSTAWAVSALKDQPGALFIGLTTNQKQALALAEIAGYGRDLAPVIARIPGRRWLYRDVWEDAPILARTGIIPVSA